MNPLTNMRNVLKLSEHELQNPNGKSWHDMYRGSAWIFIAGFPYTLSEGDIICVFSQYGEIVNINLVRDSKTGKSKGFVFLCYEDQRSTVLAVDNLNGIKILDRSLRVDHVADYKPPKDNEKLDEETLRLYMEGCAPKPINQSSSTVDVNIKKEKKDKHKRSKEKKSKKRRESSD
ncbi:LOW QUALITY PROTEIN: RNA-binding motif protein, X-linked 2 [Drosophila sulfurigaster albostrigata]|uniref:LOW QUALITY PROTEIN: RNA-binding motif protein, X-linked 2 n=1 Tax=Drosophila sulfurigaster albostrigata TaxID=89887 RepID=UPI002D21D16A|nr:LOW QUALITY PROTEIN: RNA-binding motif protein, X-linked 2 [Drosophila sulfurigaster albostrigata]